jgi:hypothetical protein
MTKDGDKRIQGEGDYDAARRFRKQEEAFVEDKQRVAEKAREAEQALDGPEGAELEEARRSTAARGADGDEPGGSQ